MASSTGTTAGSDVVSSTGRNNNAVIIGGTVGAIGGAVLLLLGLLLFLSHRKRRNNTNETTTAAGEYDHNTRTEDNVSQNSPPMIGQARYTNGAEPMRESANSGHASWMPHDPYANLFLGPGLTSPFNRSLDDNADTYTSKGLSFGILDGPFTQSSGPS